MKKFYFFIVFIIIIFNFPLFAKKKNIEPTAPNPFVQLQYKAVFSPKPSERFKAGLELVKIISDYDSDGKIYSLMEEYFNSPNNPECFIKIIDSIGLMAESSALEYGQRALLFDLFQILTLSPHLDNLLTDYKTNQRVIPSYALTLAFLAADYQEPEGPIKGNSTYKELSDIYKTILSVAPSLRNPGVYIASVRLLSLSNYLRDNGIEVGADIECKFIFSPLASVLIDSNSSQEKEKIIHAIRPLSNIFISEAIFNRPVGEILLKNPEVIQLADPPYRAVAYQFLIQDKIERENVGPKDLYPFIGSLEGLEEGCPTLESSPSYPCNTLRLYKASLLAQLNEDVKAKDTISEVFSAIGGYQNLISYAKSCRVFVSYQALKSFLQIGLPISQKENGDIKKALAETSNAVSECIREKRYPVGELKIIVPKKPTIHPSSIGLDMTKYDSFLSCIGLASSLRNPNENSDEKLLYHFANVMARRITEKPLQKKSHLLWAPLENILKMSGYRVAHQLVSQWTETMERNPLLELRVVDFWYPEQLQIISPLLGRVAWWFQYPCKNTSIKPPEGFVCSRFFFDPSISKIGVTWTAAKEGVEPEITNVYFPDYRWIICRSEKGGKEINCFDP